jgi:hypothetical protein
VSDILIAKFTELDQIVVLHAGQGYVALRVDFDELDVGESGRI